MNVMLMYRDELVPGTLLLVDALFYGYSVLWRKTEPGAYTNVGRVKNGSLVIFLKREAGLSKFVVLTPNGVGILNPNDLARLEQR